jgi:hypothetical protein
MSLDPISAVLDVGGKLIDKLWPDPVQAAEAKLKLASLEQQGELDTIKTQMSAIIAEANSSDPWTSRARPSFMYVIYIMLLMSIPMGILSAISPDSAINIISGFKQWLIAIPDSLYTLFGTGYIGYAAARSVDKFKGINK